jgi:hypothetical protein
VKKYNPSQPLIAIHIPKTGGVSVKEVFKNWFGSDLYFNYYNEILGEMPKRLDLNKMACESSSPICIYGHFNKKRGFGIKDYYPAVDQFVTIMRDPFELAVSTFFFLQKVAGNWKDNSRLPEGDLKQYLFNDYVPNTLNHFPFDVTIDNYKDGIEKHFICMGITEDMEASISRLADKLGFSVPDSIDFLNRTERNSPVPYELRGEFMERWPLEYAVYEYAKETLIRQDY